MVYIIIAMILYAATILIGSTASRNANTTVVAAVINIVSGLIPALIAIPLFSKKLVLDQKYGLIMALLAGVLIAFFVMAINKAYTLNKIGVVAPAVFGGAIFISTIASYFIFKEKVSGLQAVGLALLGIGFITIIYARATGK